VPKHIVINMKHVKILAQGAETYSDYHETFYDVSTGCRNM